MFCWHKWEKWSGAITAYGGSNYQVKRCEKCGCVYKRKISNVLTAHINEAQINKALESKK